MNTFTVNGKEYKAKEFDFNLICNLEDMGISLEEIAGKKMSMVRAYFGLCAGKDKEFAGREINAHFIGGGELDEIASIINEKIENSDFFQALSKKQETEITTDKKEAEKKK